jgi:polar amino acid transport system substrate-binding protein
VLGGAGPAPPTEISLCADVWCPYNCGPGTAQPGFAVEIAQNVFSKAGYHVTYQAVSWARCVEDARAGRFTGIIGAVLADAPDFTFPTLPIGISGAGYAVRKGDRFHYESPRDFEGRVLATVSSYNFGGEAGAYVAAHADDPKRVEFVAGDDALQKNLAKLLAGRVDLVLDDEKVLRSTVAALGLDGQITVVHGDGASPLFIAFSPAAPHSAELARILDRGIGKLRAGGGIAHVMARYHLRDGS